MKRSQLSMAFGRVTKAAPELTASPVEVAQLAPAPKVPKQSVRAGFRHYLVGGWPEFSQWIDPRNVPLCSHAHAAPSDETQRALVKKALIPGFFSSRCLTASWREHPAGSRCLVYGSASGSGKFDIFVEVQ